MLDSVIQFISDLAGGSSDPARFQDNDYRLAAAALLVHAATIDGDVSDAEREKLFALIKQRFKLDDADATALIQAATEAHSDAVDLYGFTSLLNRRMDDAGRHRVVEMLWEMAYADGRVSEFEDNLLWRAADLMHVPAQERIALRRRVANAATTFDENT